MQQDQSSVAERLRIAGLALVMVAVLARVGVGLYVVGTGPSPSLLSWQGLGRVLSAYRTDGVLPPAAQTAISVAGASGVVLWGVGLALGWWRRPS